jgi:ABC-type polysaccharide/polyol phosphate transport system ATPase subunit
MAEQPGIVFDGVWKKFRRGEMHDSLRDLIPAMTRRLAGKGTRSAELSANEFWALQDVNFRVGPGDALGIIGANGAGKSTALKTLSKILRPNRGTCTVTGRIGALIEVAAGFHPDLTGRENIFLQGSIMGMPPELIRRKFDEIVEFSGIADFLDTPVKRYSSGMNARLGFSIAAHLDPDVLIIDEVLSVGDLSFQVKAFERIGSLARSGIPVVVVSHQLDRIAQLCTGAILLERGRVAAAGSARDCIGKYVLGQSHVEAAHDEESTVLLEALEIASHDPVHSGDRIQLEVRGRILPENEEARMAVVSRVRSLHTGEYVFAVTTADLEIPLPPAGPFTLSVSLQLNTPPGTYLVDSVVYDRYYHRDVFHGPAVIVTVAPGSTFYGTVQMNPEMRFVAPTLPGPPLGGRQPGDLSTGKVRPGGALQKADGSGFSG